MARSDGETTEDFRARARAAAIDAGARTLIYGGLPPLGMDGSDDRIADQTKGDGLNE
jgi:hypothetical protein